MKQVEEKTEKVCPLNLQPCLREKCALWINVQKPIVLQTSDGKRFTDPTRILVYEGCGLITHIPFQPEPQP